MSTVSAKEKNMLLITVVIVLYAFAALSFKKQVANWTVSKKVYATAQKKFNEEQALIADRNEWAARYDQVRSLMPVFPYDKDVDTHWLNIMDSVATRTGLAIARRQTSKEAEVGDVYELPIDCKDWEGSLESLVKFLYELDQEGAMLDVRQLYARPSNKPGYLKGTFTLTCAYMRGNVPKSDSAGDEPAAEAGAAAEKAASPSDPATNAPAAVPSGPQSTGKEDVAEPPSPAPLPPPAASSEKSHGKTSVTPVSKE